MGPIDAQYLVMKGPWGESHVKRAGLLVGSLLVPVSVFSLKRFTKPHSGAFRGKF